MDEPNAPRAPRTATLTTIIVILLIGVALAALSLSPDRDRCEARDALTWNPAATPGCD